MKSNEKIYLCIGEDFTRHTRIGFCGQAHTIDKWLELLFPEYDKKQISNYFSNMTEKEILDYINTIKSKKLKRIKPEDAALYAIN